MNYEEKYKEALNLAKSYYENHEGGANQFLDTIFPELRENEDERISREITKFLVDYYNGEYERLNENTIDSWLSWLKMQGEQKPADKIEPKFKEGDYVANDDSSIVAQIEGVSTNGYYYTFKNIKPSISYSAPNCEFVDKYYHLWTIEDAKDGDVLALEWKDEYQWQKIVIFKSLNEFGVEGYGNTFKNNKLAFKEDVPYYSKTWSKYLHPATKEQRDLLFQKMSEVGYEWVEKTKQVVKQDNYA